MPTDTTRALALSDKLFELTAADRIEPDRARRAFRLAAIELRRMVDEYQRLAAELPGA